MQIQAVLNVVNHREMLNVFNVFHFLPRKSWHRVYKNALKAFWFLDEKDDKKDETQELLNIPKNH